MSRRSTPAAHRRPTGPQPTPPQTEVPPMQPPAQPQQPPIILEDEALALIWAPRDRALAEAEEAARLAIPFEEAAAEARKNAATRRAEADQARRDAEKADAEAAELEAQANQHARDAKLHRDDEKNHRKNAHQIGDAVQIIAGWNGKTHPAMRQQRELQMAAANGQHDPLTAKLGEVVANGVSETRPFAQIQPEATQ